MIGFRWKQEFYIKSSPKILIQQMTTWRSSTDLSSRGLPSRRRSFQTPTEKEIDIPRPSLCLDYSAYFYFSVLFSQSNLFLWLVVVLRLSSIHQKLSKSRWKSPDSTWKQDRCVIFSVVSYSCLWVIWNCATFYTLQLHRFHRLIVSYNKLQYRVSCRVFLVRVLTI